ncbi:MAG TPA: DEAD/DEAH box helicase [Pseudonocardiaceae bacterium]
MSGDAAAALHPVVLYHVVNTLGWPALRPLQEAAVRPLLRGDDALLLAPTAGGKTEAAAFPLLTRMANEDWRGLSVLYVCPLRALLNNLEPRLAGYAAWLGRTARAWHGDTAATARRRMTADRPDILLTTPESLESMLVSTLVDPRELFAGLRAVVVDEVHAFAGDDRGWHLLAVLERLTRLTGRPLQRIGLSATVGNPETLLAWLQGGNRGHRPASVVAPAMRGAAEPELHLDHVGTIPNAAKVVAALHRGEKRLVFADSRRTVEALAVALREHGVQTFVSHSSLSPDERRRAETAFAEARDCVIVATSTLELGIDVGDLDRVIQIGAPRTVASFLQRLGRTGRRPGTRPNMLLLATGDDELLQAAGLLRLWSEGYVEPVTAPPTPRHLLAQQLLALCLQEGRVGEAVWPEWLGPLPLAGDGEAARIAVWLVETGHLDRDGGMLFAGPEAEHRYGRRHFLELLSVFSAAPEVTVLHGRDEIGTIDPAVLTRRVAGPRVLALAGRSWRVTHVDWRRHRAWVEPTDLQGSSRWLGIPQPLPATLCDAMRRVLLGEEPERVRLSRRATTRLGTVRENTRHRVDATCSVLVRHDQDQARWWTWAGGRANAVLATALGRVAPGLVDETDRFDNRYLRVRGDARALGTALAAAREEFGNDLAGVRLDVTDEAVRQLKFAELLPPDLAHDTLAARAADHRTAAQVVRQGILGVHLPHTADR